MCVFGFAQGTNVLAMCVRSVEVTGSLPRSSAIESSRMGRFKEPIIAMIVHQKALCCG